MFIIYFSFVLQTWYIIKKKKIKLLEFLASRACL